MVGWERRMSQKLGPASLASMVTKTPMLYQTKWEVELTPRVVLWLPHMSYGMHMPVLIHMNTQARAHAHVCTHTGYTCMQTDTPTCRHLCSHADTKIKKRFLKNIGQVPFGLSLFFSHHFFPYGKYLKPLNVVFWIFCLSIFLWYWSLNQGLRFTVTTHPLQPQSDWTLFVMA